MVARPAVILDAFDDSGLDGIGEDVRDRGLEMRLAGDERVREALTEDVASPVMPAIELASVDAVQHLHPPRDARLGGSADDDKDVVVRVEQAPRHDSPADAFGHPAQQGDEREPIELVEEDRLVVDAACGEMCRYTGVEGARLARHASTVAAPASTNSARHRISPLSTHIRCERRDPSSHPCQTRARVEPETSLTPWVCSASSGRNLGFGRGVDDVQCTSPPGSPFVSSP